MSSGGAKFLSKKVKDTNIVVVKPAGEGETDPHTALLHAIADDDKTEILWFTRTLRPERNLIHPAEAFLQGIKELRPAPVFNTFNVKKAKERRLIKQEYDRKKHLERRKAAVAPTAAFKDALNPRKLPRNYHTSETGDEEVRLLGASLEERKMAKRKYKYDKTKPFFTKWKKKKVQSIGKGL
ncbi:hypothetical protein AGDE_04617 [Angomonas deanei]|nr:hypothetical protein AGDE_04617 [Angomonas deanei]|eukprot:EPY39311.1 hypothetical protein AGDE_04617 [Angomonas deanei]